MPKASLTKAKGVIASRAIAPGHARRSRYRATSDGMRSAIATAALVTVSSLPGSASAGIAYTGLYVAEDYTQTAAKLTFAGTFFNLYLDTVAASDFNAATVSIPGQSAAVALNYHPVLDFTGFYRTSATPTSIPSADGNVSVGLATLAAALPFGTYTFTATSPTNPSQTATLQYNSNSWPTVPRGSGQTAVPALTAASYAGLQGMNAGAAHILNFNPFTGTGLPAPGEVDPGLRLSVLTATGQTVYSSPMLPAGTTSLQLPANTLQANTAYQYKLDFFNDLHCGVGSTPCGSTDPGDAVEFDTETVGTFTTGATPTSPPTSVTLQGGTLANPVPLQSQGQIGQVNGLIGGQGAMDFYLFNWTGGPFVANAALTGSDPNATYEFELLDVLGHVLQDITLDADDNFSADLTAMLSAGKYEIGLLNDSPFDPPFTITFVTPVNGVPEPGTLGLVVLGLTGLGLSRRRKRSERLGGVPLQRYIHSRVIGNGLAPFPPSLHARNW